MRRVFGLALVLLMASTACASRDRDGGRAATSTSPPTTSATDPGSTSTSATPPTSGPANPPPDEAAATTAVVVDPASRFQRIDGFGSTARLFDDPHVTETFDPSTKRAKVVVPPEQQDAILRALYVDLGLTRMRPATGDGPIQSTRGGPFDFSWKLNDGFVDLARRADQIGLRTTFLSPIRLESWMTEGDPEGYASWAFEIIKRWSDLGRPLQYYSIVNEPGHRGSGLWSGEFIRDAIKALGPKLRAAGLDTKILLPDDLNPKEAANRIGIVMSDPEAAAYVGAFGYHLYKDPSGGEKVRELGARFGRPVWMTEFYEADAFAWLRLMHDLLADKGVSAVDYLWGFFGQWQSGGEQLVVLRHDAAGRYLGFDRSLQYYFFGQYSRFVSPGSVRVSATSSSPSVLVSAYDDRTRTTVVAINADAAPVTASFAAPGARGGKVTAVRSGGADRWAPAAVSLTGGDRFIATMPPNSVTTFVVAKS